MSKTIRIGFIAIAMMLLLGIVGSGAYAESKKLTNEFYIISETYGVIAPGITDKRIVINSSKQVGNICAF